MSTPYGNDPQQPWGQQPHGQQQWGQQPQYPQSGPLPQQPQSGPQPQQQYPGYEQQQQWGQQPAQPAQPQYEQQQWQQPQQPAQQQYPGYEQPAGYQGGYGQYPSFEAEDGGGKKSKAWLWITLTVVVLAAGAVAVLGFVAPGFFNTTVFDNTSLEKGVVEIAKTQYGLDATNPSCPDDIKVEKDATGDCSATVNGKQMTFPIKVVDVEADPPKYEVGQPK